MLDYLAATILSGSFFVRKVVTGRKSVSDGDSPGLTHFYDKIGVNMDKLKNLEPKSVFRFFEEISAVPRGSGNREGISSYLVKFAKDRGLEYIRDEYDNCIIKKPAQGGSLSRDAVIIQGHTDMVTVSAPGKKKDFQKEGIDLLIDGDYLYADGTTLGADDGVAVCFALAVLDDKEMVHPPIEAVFTSDEEIGLIGANKLDTSVLSGKIFLNIDSEDDGIFFAGCAGGCTCTIKDSYQPEEAIGRLLTLKVADLTGGHSGMEIDKRRANANKILATAVYELAKRFDDLYLLSFDGGEKDNAIATMAEAKLIYSGEDLQDVIGVYNALSEELLSAYKATDPEALCLANAAEKISKAQVLPKDKAVSILKLLADIDDGVIAMSDQLEDVVETSSNTGITRINETSCSITILVRSLITEKITAQTAKISALAGDGFEVELSGIYSAWSYEPVSPARDILMEEYRRVTGKEPKQMVIHAGLECGVFAEKMPGTDFVSFGPQADDIHTFKERLSISSTADYWEILKNTLKRLA